MKPTEPESGRTETIVIGAGQSGLAMSYHLSALGRAHLVLERGRVAQRWRTERWESLRFQFPNRFVRLPGQDYDGDEPDGFMHRDEVVATLERYAVRIRAPIRVGIVVRRLRQDGAGGFLVETDDATLAARNVVVATGPYQTPQVPEIAGGLPRALVQITASRYTRPDALPPGAVLVVGAGGSGAQIAEDLVDAGRRVYLSAGSHRVLPRRYRGLDVTEWLERLGVLDRDGAEIGPEHRAPLMTGVGGGRDLSLDGLARRGVTVVGRLRTVSGSRLELADDLAGQLAQGRQSYLEFQHQVDAYLADRGERVEPAAAPLAPAARGPGPSHLDLDAAGIAAVIWATGYRYELGWLECPVLDEMGSPVHRRGVTGVDGLYFLGLKHLSKVRSAVLWGVGEDAARLASEIARRSD